MGKQSSFFHNYLIYQNQNECLVYWITPYSPTFVCLNEDGSTMNICDYPHDCVGVLLVDEIVGYLIMTVQEASSHMLNADEPTCPGVICNLMYRFMGTLTESADSIMSSIKFPSAMWNH